MQSRSNFTCPRCGAAPGFNCRTKSGNPTGDHALRARLNDQKRPGNESFWRRSAKAVGEAAIEAANSVGGVTIVKGWTFPHGTAFIDSHRARLTPGDINRELLTKRNRSIASTQFVPVAWHLTVRCMVEAESTEELGLIWLLARWHEILRQRMSDPYLALVRVSSDFQPGWWHRARYVYPGSADNSRCACNYTGFEHEECDLCSPAGFARLAESECRKFFSSVFVLADEDVAGWLDKMSGGDIPPSQFNLSAIDGSAWPDPWDSTPKGAAS